MEDEQLAAALVEALEDAGRIATYRTAKYMVVRAKAKLPKGDPTEDPNPAVALRNLFQIEQRRSSTVISLTAPYVVKQHESRHLRHPRGGGRKFLEESVIESIPVWEAELAIEVEKNVHKLENKRLRTSGSREHPIPDVLGAIAELLEKGTLTPGVPAGPSGSLIRFGDPVD